MNAPALKKLRATAIESAHAAGAVLRKHFGKKLRVSEKRGAGLVTNADVAAEDACIKVLRRGFPEFGILAEESEPSPQASARAAGRFVIDPLDGTTNFVHSFPMFCVSVGAQWEGETLVGVIYHPILDETYVAVKGQGAFVNGHRIAVSRTRKLSDSLLTTGFAYRKEDFLKIEMQAFQRLSGIARAVRRPGSAALDLAYTARGVFDGFWERKLAPWDVAAGALLVQEAGGRVTNYAGGAFEVEHPEIVASNGKLHALLLQTVAPEFCLLPSKG